MSVITYRTANLYTCKDNYGFSVGFSWQDKPCEHFKGGRDKNLDCAIRKCKLTVDACLDSESIENRFLSMKLR